MPEYPEIVVAVERLRELAQGSTVQQVRIAHPFFLRSAHPPVAWVEGLILRDVRRMQKQIVLAFPGDLFMVLHLMLSGRLHWRESGCAVPRRSGLAAIDFEDGSLLIAEPSTKKRASLHLVEGRDPLRPFDCGGLEILEATLDTFRRRIRVENHTLKRALTDQSIISGVGNAYSDEILHRARLSPFLLTQSINDEQIERLYAAARDTLVEWTERVRQSSGSRFPGKTKGLREQMAVHGRYRQPCPVCQTPIQRIRYATRETNYCPRCQTEGRVLADRVLSRLLKDDWPSTAEELERGHRGS